MILRQLGRRLLKRLKSKDNSILSKPGNRANNLSLKPSVNHSKKSINKKEFNIIRSIKAFQAIRTNLMSLFEAKLIMKSHR